MSVFLLFSASLGSLYAYDRSECKRLQKEYLDKVRWMSQETLDSSEMPRKVKVLGARVPDDGELERSSKWFKKYMKVSSLTLHSRAEREGVSLNFG